jgi:hypothetical protein
LCAAAAAVVSCVVKKNGEGFWVGEVFKQMICMTREKITFYQGLYFVLVCWNCDEDGGRKEACSCCCNTRTRCFSTAIIVIICFCFSLVHLLQHVPLPCFFQRLIVFT